MASELALVVAFLVVVVAMGVGLRAGQAQQRHTRMVEGEMDEIRSEMRSGRWAMQEEERARWLREWSLLTMDPPPGTGAPQPAPGLQSGSNTLMGDIQMDRLRWAIMQGWDPATDRFWRSPETDPSRSTPLSTPSRSGPRRIGRPPEEMRLTRFLDGGSPENVPSG